MARKKFSGWICLDLLGFGRIWLDSRDATGNRWKRLKCIGERRPTALKRRC